MCVCVCVCVCVCYICLLNVQDFRTKSKDGKIPGAPPLAEKQYKDELERLKRIYGGGDLQFPKFTFEEK